MSIAIVYGYGGFNLSKPNNNIVEQYDVPDVQAPLDSTGALATLLAVTEVLDVTDAANAVGLFPDDLVAEAEAWAAAAVTPPPEHLWPKEDEGVAATELSPARVGRLRAWWRTRRSQGGS